MPAIPANIVYLAIISDTSALGFNLGLIAKSDIGMIAIIIALAIRAKAAIYTALRILIKLLAIKTL
ncbi:hypothetical protein IHI24_000244 [Rickettsia endosymbiont of Cardiosporidium cionae]|nr:hypothetical protein IHI24_000244 [Rickettsia endosymbiont of Cardiosporidium cionae]